MSELLKRRSKRFFSVIGLAFTLGLLVYFGRTEWRYFQHGEKAVALLISDEFERTGKGGRNVLQYRFRDDVLDTERQEKDWYRALYSPVFTERRELEHVFIEYIPGERGASRLDGNSPKSYIIGTLVVAVCLAYNVAVSLKPIKSKSD